jgi:hypothetical protein
MHEQTIAEPYNQYALTALMTTRACSTTDARYLDL